MSLVQAYITENLIVVGGDRRATIKGFVVDNFTKVYKLNPTTIIGMTGTIEGNRMLFQDFVNESLVPIRNTNLNYMEIEQILLSRFYEIDALPLEIKEKNHFHSVICGWNGDKMTGKAFFLFDDNPELQGINDLTKKDGEDVRFVSCGNVIHQKNMEELKNEIRFINGVQLKNLFKSVVDRGIFVDETINNNITLEKIRKVDVV